MRTQHITGEQTTKTFTYLWTGSRHMLEQGKNNEAGRLYACISSLIFSAFMLEAYFNHLGKIKNNNWDRQEKNISKLKKYTNFAIAAGVNFNENERPYKSMRELFLFRDTMAHGKTTEDRINVVLEASSTLIIPATKWQKFATLENAERCLEDAVALVRELHSASGYEDDPFFSNGKASYAIHQNL